MAVAKNENSERREERESWNSGIIISDGRRARARRRPSAARADWPPRDNDRKDDDIGGGGGFPNPIDRSIEQSAIEHPRWQ